MLNQTPLWKYLVVIFMVAVCALYASPNLYGEDYAVQISAGRDGEINTQLMQQVTDELGSQGIEAKRIVMEDNQISGSPF